jgi:hypothetical protein
MRASHRPATAKKVDRREKMLMGSGLDGKDGVSDQNRQIARAF